MFVRMELVTLGRKAHSKARAVNIAVSLIFGTVATGFSSNNPLVCLCKNRVSFRNHFDLVSLSACLL